METGKWSVNRRYIFKAKAHRSQEVVLLSEDDYCRMEMWYKDIEPVTFESEWLDLKLEEANALLEKRDVQRTIATLGAWEKNKSQFTLDEYWPPEKQQILDDLAARLGVLTSSSQPFTYLHCLRNGFLSGLVIVFQVL
jgi:hypothetical protein